MTYLTNNATSYFIISAFKIENNNKINEQLSNQLKDDLYIMDYSVTVLESYLNNKAFKSFLVNCNANANDNNDLRLDAIKMMDKYEQNSVIIKYTNEEVIKKIGHDGNEHEMSVIDFTTECISYKQENNIFSLKECKRYTFPKESAALSIGTIVEVFGSSGNWIQKTVKNPKYEWDNSLKLLSKYNKIRIPY